MGKQALESQDGVQSLVKGFLILEIVVDRGGRSTITEIVDACGLPLGTVHRLVRTLVDIGYLRQEASRGYTLGSRVLFLADMAPTVLNRVALPDLRRIASMFGETVQLSRLDQREALCIAQAPGKNAIRHVVEVGSRTPAHASASAKAILAFRKPEVAQELFGREPLTTFTDRTVTDFTALTQELSSTRERGVAFARQEYDPFVSAIAVPVPQTTVRTAVELSAPAERLTDALVEAALPELRALAEQLAVEFCRPVRESAPSLSPAREQVMLLPVD